MLFCKPCSTPLPSSLKLIAIDCIPFKNPRLYRSIGSLQYIIVTQPKLAYCVNRVCQFAQNPLDTNWKMVKCILLYLSGIADYSLNIRKSDDLRVTSYSDLDWGSDLDDRKSTSGYCDYLGPNLIS